MSLLPQVVQAWILNFMLWILDSRHCPGTVLKDRQEPGDIEIIQIIVNRLESASYPDVSL